MSNHISQEGLNGLRAAIQTHIDRNEITGAVTAVAVNNQLVWHEAQGVRDIKTGAPMQTDDIFRMMSSTKPLTAVAVLMMQEEGRLSIDDAVSRFIPSFKGQKVAVAPQGTTDPLNVVLEPAHRDVTIKDLLTHTSGLTTIGVDLRGGPGSLVNKVERRPDDTLAEYVPRLGSAALDNQPGALWRYSPLDGFDVLLRIVEIVSEIPGDVFFRERILEPLGMQDTHFTVPAEKQHRILELYSKEGGNWLSQKPLLAELPSTYVSGAGGLFSTATDFLQFELMLLNQGSLNGRKLLAPASVSLMTQNHAGNLFAEFFPPLTGGSVFGLGVAILKDESKGFGTGAGTFGWGGAYGTETWADPKSGIAAVLLVQQAVPTVKPAFQKALRSALSTVPLPSGVTP